MQVRDKVYLERTENGHQVLTANHGNVGGGRKERSYGCDICGQAFKESDTIEFRGLRYGKPCGDYQDISSILRKEAADAGMAKPRRSEADSPIIIEGSE